MLTNENKIVINQNIWNRNKILLQNKENKNSNFLKIQTHQNS